MIFVNGNFCLINTNLYFGLTQKVWGHLEIYNHLFISKRLFLLFLAHLIFFGSNGEANDDDYNMKMIRGIIEQLEHFSFNI